VLDCAEAFRRLIWVSENTPIASVPISSTANASRNVAFTDKPLSRTARERLPCPRDGDGLPAISPSGTNPAPVWPPSETAFIFLVPTYRTAGQVGSGINAFLSGSTA
jgi:hypothetical protein